LIIQTDASLSGYAAVFRDASTGKDIFATAKTAFTTTDRDGCYCNRLEILAILVALRKLPERLKCYQNLRLVKVETDSYVAAANCDRYTRNTGSNVEQVAIIRSSCAIHGILTDLENLGIEVIVNHVPGKTNVIADALSTIPGRYRNIVFGSQEKKAIGYNTTLLRNQRDERRKTATGRGGSRGDETEDESIKADVTISVRRIRQANEELIDPIQDSSERSGEELQRVKQIRDARARERERNFYKPDTDLYGLPSLKAYLAGEPN